MTRYRDPSAETQSGPRMTRKQLRAYRRQLREGPKASGGRLNLLLTIAGAAAGALLLTIILREIALAFELPNPVPALLRFWRGVVRAFHALTTL